MWSRNIRIALLASVPLHHSWFVDGLYHFQIGKKLSRLPPFLLWLYADEVGSIDSISYRRYIPFREFTVETTVLQNGIMVS